MMYKKGLTLLIAVMITVMLSPFRIYADTIPSNEPATYTKEVLIKEQGTTQSVSYSGGTLNVSNFYAEFKVHGILYQSYIGYINVKVTYQYQSRNGNNGWNYETKTKTVSHYVSVYGNSFEWIDDFSYIADSYGGNSVNISSTINITSLEISASNVQILEDDSEILSDIRTQIDELVNTLNEMNNKRQWSIPFESFSFVNMFFNKGLQPTYFATYNYFNFPVFSCTSNDKLFLYWSSNLNYDLVLGVSENLYNIDQVKRYLQFDNSNIDITGYQRVGQFNYGTNQRICWILKLTVINKGSEGQYNMWFNNVDVIPIYFNRSDYRYISNDFALQFGLSNYFIDSILNIANGTSASQSAADDSQTANSQLQSTSNQLFTQEDSFKSDMNNAMQNIPSFSVNNFGSKFMSSATWVRQQYERMTNNTPFQQVITFSLLVGLSMILIGKVRK